MLRLRFAHVLIALGALALAAPVAAAAPRTPTARHAAGSAAAAARNLLVNPDFEQTRPNHPWMPAGWDTTVSGLPSVFFGRDTMLAHGQGYAVSVVNVSTLMPMNHGWTQSLVIPPAWWGKDLVFSVWTRSNGVTGRAFVRMSAACDTINKMAKIWKISRTEAADRLDLRGMNDPMQELGWKVRYFSDEESDWVKRELRLPLAPSTNYLLISLGLAGTGQVLFDDASLELVRHAPDPPLALHQNLLADPSFEGSGDDWEYSAPPYEGFRIDHDSTDAHGGRVSIRYSGGLIGPVKVNAGVCQAFTNRNLAGKRLRLSAWTKTDSLLGEAYVMLFFKTLHGPEHPIPDDRVWGNTPWKQTQIEADVPPDTYEVWAWAVSQSPAPGRIWFDDMRLEVLGPAQASTRPVAGTRGARR